MSESKLLGLFISADGDMLALSIEGELFIQMYVCVLCVCVISCTCGWVWGCMCQFMCGRSVASEILVIVILGKIKAIQF